MKPRLEEIMPTGARRRLPCQVIQLDGVGASCRLEGPFYPGDTCWCSIADGSGVSRVRIAEPGITVAVAGAITFVPLNVLRSLLE